MFLSASLQSGPPKKLEKPSLSRSMNLRSAGIMRGPTYECSVTATTVCSDGVPRSAITGSSTARAAPRHLYAELFRAIRLDREVADGLVAVGDDYHAVDVAVGVEPVGKLHRRLRVGACAGVRVA